MAPLVSVVMPAFNVARTIARAVGSIQAQTLADWELIVIDDGSTDGTRQLIEGIASADLRVRLLTREHGGIAAALTTGLSTARGEFIARMDADDESMPDRLAEQVAFLESPDNPDIGLVGCLVE